MANTSILSAFERMWQHVVAALGTKADSNHSHDDKYYTETEIDLKLSGLASSDNITSAISTHNSATDAHSDIRATLAEVKEDVDTFFKDATLSAAAKDTLKEIQDYITSDVEAAAAMTASINNKAEKEHGHAIAEITGLQDALNANSGSITELTEAIEAAKAAASEQDAVVLAEAQSGINAVQVNLDTYAETVNNALASAAGAISAHTEAISAHTTSIATLQTEIDNIVEITSQEIQSLFQA